MATTDMFSVVAPIYPYRDCIRFLGGDVDDYLQVDAAAAAAADSYTSGTISAWIMCPDDTGTYTIVGTGDKDVVEFIELNVEAGLLTCRCTDNTTAQFVTQADDKLIQKHKWYHVAVVQRVDGKGVHLFINGEEIDRTNDTATEVNAWFKACAGIDSGRIGAANKAGNDSVTQEFKGYISDVKIWNVPLTNDQIKEDYEGNGTTTGLINHWDFQGDYLDAGTGADNGTAVGDICLCYGANPFISKLTFNPEFTMVTADHPRIAINDKIGVALAIDAA